MEINTEISKVFGQEMAKLFASQISEEEMMAAAREAWRQLNKHDYSYREQHKSELEKLIESCIIQNVMERVEKKLQEPESEEELEKEAISIVLEAKAKSREMIVQRLAEGYARAPFISHDLKSITNDISRIVFSAMNR